MDGRPCPFLEAHPQPGVREPVALPSLELEEPSIIVDVRAPEGWLGDHRELWQRTADTLQGCVALLGEHVDNAARADDAGVLPAPEVIRILRAGGVGVIATVTGRDRDVGAAAALIEEYRDAGVTAIHCVTGDHPAAMGIDRPARFGAEAMTLIGAAVAAGVPATVAESPASPGPRAERLATKQRAGAALCVLNHAGDPAELTAFADSCRASGATLPLIAPVPMVADRRAALGLAAFPGLRLPHGFLDEIIEADAEECAGLEASRRFIRAVAASSRFAGINLSGGAGGLDPWDRLRLTGDFVAVAKVELNGEPR